ncbi:hypothetical protein [Ornithinibacillus halotolerans]|uniref:Uncharacterized protein n=1 Tax=Ornithinibacillus halotolerans TaxID=1274357 RepID=A0A916RSW8_9BACI|nr:hypothetical protein [Ornithinibacillus halotolerans]GGA68667.1 hypothetical protein GCM10008025_10830 [Ornithinibacillus halotolerans]
MEQFLPIIIIIIIGIIRSLSGGNQNEKQQKQQRPNVPRPRPSSTPSGQPNPEQTVYKTANSDKERSKRTPKQTVYQSDPSNVYVEQQKQQMEELKQRVQGRSSSDMITSVSSSNDLTGKDITELDMSIGPAITDAIRHQTSTKLNEKQEAFKKDVQTGLTYKGLVQGVIMSEVLGPPRARKPYRSVIQERKRNTR